MQRAHIVAGKHRHIGKESDRRWEEADELESLSYAPVEFELPGTKPTREELVRASESLIRKVRKIGIRELVRFGYSRRALDKICRREFVKESTLREYERAVQEYKPI